MWNAARPDHKRAQKSACFPRIASLGAPAPRCPCRHRCRARRSSADRHVLLLHAKRGHARAAAASLYDRATRSAIASPRVSTGAVVGALAQAVRRIAQSAADPVRRARPPRRPRRRPGRNAPPARRLSSRLPRGRARASGSHVGDLLRTDGAVRRRGASGGGREARRGRPASTPRPPADRKIAVISRNQSRTDKWSYGVFSVARDRPPGQPN